MDKSTNLKLQSNLTSTYSMVDGLSLQNLFFARNNIFPNCYMFNHSSREQDFYFDTPNLLKYIIENTPEDENLEHIKYIVEDINTKEERMGFCVIFNKSNLYARVERSISETYILYSNENESALADFKKLLENYYVSPEEEKNNLYKISSNSSGFHLIKSKIKEVPDFNLERQYNDDFIKEDAKIRKFIEDDDRSGLAILHGLKGAGKTTYIRNLITSFPNRKFVFVPSGLIEILGQPSFASFLMGLYNHVIILEDCESAIRDRKSMDSQASAVSLLLNMSDGLLSDDLGIKFICTFNEDIKNIDEALMRKGRLVSKYEFKTLTLEKTNALLEYIYKDREDIPVPVSTKGLTLADIYNYEDDSYETARKSII